MASDLARNQLSAVLDAEMLLRQFKPFFLCLRFILMGHYINEIVICATGIVDDISPWNLFNLYQHVCTLWNIIHVNYCSFIENASSLQHIVLIVVVVQNKYPSAAGDILVSVCRFALHLYWDKDRAHDRCLSRIYIIQLWTIIACLVLEHNLDHSKNIYVQKFLRIDALQ